MAVFFCIEHGETLLEFCVYMMLQRCCRCGTVWCGKGEQGSFGRLVEGWEGGEGKREERGVGRECLSEELLLFGRGGKGSEKREERRVRRRRREIWWRWR